MAEITYDIVKHIGTVPSSGAWEVQLNSISWNHRKPNFDLRKWNTETDKMSKGITLSEDELRGVYEILKDYFGED